MYDIAVIGLGPAGAFFVRHLDKKFRVIAIDRKLPKDKQGFHKPCGGLLAPDAQKSLSRFNMTLPKDILVSPQIFSVRTIDIKKGLTRYYQRHYINLDRHKFDQWLIDHIPKHIEVHTNAYCQKIERNEDCYKIEYIENHEHKTVFAKKLVGADGAASKVRRTFYKDIHINTYLSIQQWFLDVHENPFYSCVFDSDITDSYAWGLTKNEYFIFGGAFKVKTGKQDFETLKKKVRKYGFVLDNPLKTEACLVLGPLRSNYCCGDKDIFLIGEAAGFISPSSLEGISYAIDSGYLLSKCINNYEKDANYEYKKATKKIRQKLVLKSLKHTFLYNPFLRSMIMKSGVSSISVLE